MTCIVIDDEPIARKGVEKLIAPIGKLKLLGSFNSAETASEFLQKNKTDLIFLDIEMPGTSGIEFARNILRQTLVIFTTAYSEYALDSYEVDAIDYLVKPIDPAKFRRAADKAISYHSLLVEEEKQQIDAFENESIFVRSDRRYHKVDLENILFIEGLKDYVIIQMAAERLITHMNVKNMHARLPESTFLRVNRSYIINKNHIDSFDNNDVFIGDYEISIGNSYRDAFFDTIMKNKP